MTLIYVTLEEFIFRRKLLNNLQQKTRWAVLISSALFGFAHLLNLTVGYEFRYVIYQVLFAFVIGIALSLIRLNTNSLLLCILLHFFINSSPCIPVDLYIDPATGSMLFAILLGILGALRYMLKVSIVKFKFLISGGKVITETSEKIPIVIFSDDKRYWSIFKPICKELDSRGVDVVYMTASLDDEALNNEFEHIKAEFIGEGNKAFARLNFLDARILLATTPGLDVYQWKRSKSVDCYVHIIHAANDVTLYKMFGLDYYDAVLLSGKYQVNEIRKLESLRNLPAKELCLVGLPYMDDMVNRLKENPRTPSNQKTVLLAPSWGKSAIFSKFGDKILEKLVETGYHIIVRPHPQSFISEKDLIDPIMKKYPNSNQIEWNRDSDNFNVLNQSDILISDFSGVILDFALCYDKPVIFTDTQFDKRPYDAWWVDNDIWNFSILPKIGMELNENNMDNIKELIDTCLTSQVYEEGRNIARLETWENCGNGAVKTADWIINKYTSILDNKEK